MSETKLGNKDLLKEAIVEETIQPYKIPANWVWIKAIKLFNIQYGKGLPTSKLMDKGYPVYGANGKIGFYSQYTQEYAQVLMTCRGATCGTINVSEPKSFVTNNSLVLKPNWDADLNFIKYLFLTLDKNDLISGSAQPQITIKAFENFFIPLPPMNEQKRIAEKVDRLIHKIEQAKKLIVEAKKSFELRRAAILDKAFQGELTEKWRKDNRPILSAKDRLEAIKKDRFEIAESKRETLEVKEMYEQLNLVESVNDNDWLYLKANMFCHNITCGSTPSADLSSEGEIPFLKVYNIVGNKIAFSYKPQYIPKDVHETKLKKSILKPDDVIMNIVGPPLKKIALIPKDYNEMNMNQAIIRFRPLKYVLPKYLYYCLQYEDTLKDVINSTRGVVGQSNISISQSRNLVIPVPAIEEQKIIVRRLEDLIEREESALEILSNKKALDTLKQTILSKAFRGELGTNDPDEENAIEFLTEILQEKAKK